MEVQNLDQSKEVAKRENWNQRLLEYQNEAEDAFPIEDSTEEKTGQQESKESDGEDNDPWDRACNTACLAPGTSKSPEIKKTIEFRIADEDDTDDDNRYYSDEGITEERTQTGALRANVKSLLSGHVPDVKMLSERKIQVDLSFIPNARLIGRTKKIIEDVIKVYTAVPGKVETTTVSSDGVFTFNVTNNYLSPESDSSTPSPYQRVKHSNMRKTPQAITRIQELVEGLVLVPKFVGLPKKVLKYGRDGLTEDGVSKLIMNHPESSIFDIVSYALSQAGQKKKIFNLYRFPK